MAKHQYATKPPNISTMPPGVPYIIGNEAAERFLREWNPAVRLDRLVMHSRNTVFCNFFFAKPKFWKAWLQVAERLLEHAETPSSPLYPSLTSTLDYVRDDGLAKPAQMKIFVMERLASYLLATNGFVTRSFPPFDMPLTPGFVGRIPNLVVFDALTTTELARIVDLQVALLAKRLADRRLVLEVTPAARDWLALTGFDPAYGARPLRRLVQREIGDRLARGLLAGEIVDGDTVLVDAASVAGEGLSVQAAGVTATA